jgi:hypothetical protein
MSKEQVATVSVPLQLKNIPVQFRNSQLCVDCITYLFNYNNELVGIGGGRQIVNQALTDGSHQGTLNVPIGLWRELPGELISRGTAACIASVKDGDTCIALSSTAGGEGGPVKIKCSENVFLDHYSYQ